MCKGQAIVCGVHYITPPCRCRAECAAHLTLRDRISSMRLRRRARDPASAECTTDELTLCKDRSYAQTDTTTTLHPRVSNCLGPALRDACRFIACGHKIKEKCL